MEGKTGDSQRYILYCFLQAPRGFIWSCSRLERCLVRSTYVHQVTITSHSRLFLNKRPSPLSPFPSAEEKKQGCSMFLDELQHATSPKSHRQTGRSRGRSCIFPTLYTERCNTYIPLHEANYMTYPSCTIDILLGKNLIKR